MTTALASAAPPSRARATIGQLLARAGLSDTARACRRTVRHAMRRAVGHDAGLVARYLAGTATPRLHIGCGPHQLPGWLNADFEPVAPAIVHLDATRPFPLPTGTFDAVFSEHMIEHVPARGGQAMLDECFRVLRPGGRLRITTPDLAFLAGLYQPELSPLQRAYVDWATATFVQDAPGGDPVFVINNFVRAWGHLFIYDERTLRAAMARAGFGDIERFALHDSHDPALRDLENVDRMPPGFLQLESFTLEAVKPAAAPH